MKACWMVCLVTALSARRRGPNHRCKACSSSSKTAGAQSGEGKCAPASHLSDNDFANKVLATDGNKNAVREATLAKERNNQKSYQAAIDKIVCPAK